MNRVLEFIIRAKDSTASGLKSARENFHGMAQRVGSGIKGMVSSMAAWAGVTVSVGAAVKLFSTAIQEAFKFEKYQTSFKLLTGSLESAKAHMADLRDLAKGTFNFTQLADASSKMMLLTKNVLGGKESMKMLADAAQAVGADLPSLAQDVGMAFANLTAGGDISRTLMQLEQTGAVSKETGMKLREMADKGAPLSAMWKMLEADLLRFKGSVEEAGKTGVEMKDDLKDSWTDALAEFGTAFMGVSKDGIGALTDKLIELRENGDIAVWADEAKTGLMAVTDIAITLGKAIASIWENFSKMDMVANMKGVSAAVGSRAGGDIKGALRAFQKEAVKGQMAGGLNKLLGDPLNLASENDAEAAAAAKDKAFIRAKAIDRNAAAKADDAAKAMAEKKKIDDALAAGQRVEDQKKAAEAQKKSDSFNEKAAKAEKEAVDKSEQESIDAQKDLQERRKQEAKDLAKEKVKMKEKGIQGQIEVNAEQLAQQLPGVGAAQARLQKADKAVDSAWGWYKDPKAFKAQLKAEKDEAKIESKFEKDATNLQKQADWRTRKLSAKDEAVRRMVLAKEEQQAAQDALQNIERHVANLQQIQKDLQKALNAAGG